MVLLIISDLHVDPGDSFGTFGWNEIDFIMQTEMIREEYKIDKVVLNGDIFELIKYTYDQLTEKKRELIRYFENRNFICIRGNHDIVSRNGLDYFDTENSEGFRIHIEHGHNADWMNGTKVGRAFSRAGLSILKILTRSKILMRLYQDILSSDEHLKSTPKRYNTFKYLTYALRLLKKYDVVILGHTHKLESHHTYYLNRKKRYLNCGTCSMGRFQGIILDTETLKYEMIKESKESIAKALALNLAI